MKIIGTTKISTKIESLLDSADKFLILVTPYLKLTPRFRVKLSNAIKRVEEVHFIFRENQLNKEDVNWLNSFSNVNLYPIQNLHAKIYFNESTCLITSMNLYEYSQINNHEICVVMELSKSNLVNDKRVYIDTLTELRTIVETKHQIELLNNLISDLDDFTMGRIFKELAPSYTFLNFKWPKDKDGIYQFLCDKAREKVKFSDDELYQDKSVILRNTHLGEERYMTIRKFLISLSN